MTSSHWWFAGASFLPYFSLALYDGWMHEKARKVPRIEQALHAVLAISLCSFVLALIFNWPFVFKFALSSFVLASIADEFGFHRYISKRERRVHFAAWAALAFFVLVAYRW